MNNYTLLSAGRGFGKTRMTIKKYEEYIQNLIIDNTPEYRFFADHCVILEKTFWQLEMLRRKGYLSDASECEIPCPDNIKNSPTYKWLLKVIGNG